MRRKDPVKLFERDVINGSNHCFCLHDACSSDFCSTIKQQLTFRKENTGGDDDNDSDQDKENSNGKMHMNMAILKMASLKAGNSLVGLPK